MTLVKYTTEIKHPAYHATGKPIYERCEVYKASDVEAVLKEIRPFVTHRSSCRFTTGFGPPDTDVCTCGVQQILDALRGGA